MSAACPRREIRATRRALPARPQAGSCPLRTSNAWRLGGGTAPLPAAAKNQTALLQESGSAGTSPVRHRGREYQELADANELLLRGLFRVLPCLPSLPVV